MKKKVSTLKAPLVIVWKKNCCSTIFRNSMLSEYLKEMMQVCPRIIQHIESARMPWIQLMVSLPTFRSQIELKLVFNENESRISSLKAVSEIRVSQGHDLEIYKTYSIFLSPPKLVPSRGFRQSCYCSFPLAFRYRRSCFSYR